MFPWSVGVVAGVALCSLRGRRLGMSFGRWTLDCLQLLSGSRETLMDTSLCGPLLSLLLGRFLGVKLWGLVVGLSKVRL